MGTHCQGQTEVDIQGIGPTIRAEHHGNIEYRRLSKEHGGQMDKELKRGLKERRSNTEGVCFDTDLSARLRIRDTERREIPSVRIESLCGL